jgi:hypothetical protein
MYYRCTCWKVRETLEEGTYQGRQDGSLTGYYRSDVMKKIQLQILLRR